MKLAVERPPPSIRRRLLWLLLVSMGALMGLNVWFNPLTAARPIDAAFDHAMFDDAYAVSAHIG